MAYIPRLPPYAHQQEALDKMRGREAFACIMETGTGKSCVPLHAWAEQVEAGELDNLLIIAPAGCYRNWLIDKGDDERDWSEFRKQYSQEFLGKVVSFLWKSGGSTKFKRELKHFMDIVGRPRALVVNVEAFSNVVDLRKACAEFVDSGRTMVVVDESTRIRGDSKRTEHILRVGTGAKVRVIMSGLVAPKSPLDLFYQYMFLDWRILGHRSWYTFRARYTVLKQTCVLPFNEVYRNLCIVLNRFKWLPPSRDNKAVLLPELDKIERGERHDLTKDQAMLYRSLLIDGFDRDTMVQLYEKFREISPKSIRPITITQVEGYQNIEELNEKIAAHSYIKLKKDCLDLPPKVYEMREVRLTEEQRRVYDEILENATAQLDNEAHVTATHVMTQITRLQQILCGFVRDEDGNMQPVKSNRLDELVEILEEHSGKAIIWTCYDRSVREIGERLREEFGEGSVAQFWGGNRTERAEEEKRFLNNPECRFMVSTPASGGVGNTWVVADLVIYFANSWDLEHRFQSEDRSHRIGQTKSVTYVDLMAAGTVDERIIHALRNKIDLASAVTGTNYREWLI
jgi:hypothetical protein